MESSRKPFLLGLAVGVVGAGLVGPLLMISLTSDEPSEPDPLETACQTYYGTGGDVADLLVEELDKASRQLSYPSEALAGPFASLKTSAAAAAVTEGLSMDESATFAAVTVAAERSEFELVSGSPIASSWAKDLEVAHAAVDSLCSDR